MPKKWQVQSGRRVRCLATGLAAGAAALTGTATAEAGIIYNRVGNTLNNDGMFKIDLNGDGTLEANLVLNNISPVSQANSGLNNILLNPLNGSGWAGADRTRNPLNNNDLVGPNSNFMTTNFELANQNGNNPVQSNNGWAGVNNGLLGVMFDIPGGSPHFGWVRISVGDTMLSITTEDWAYESIANQDIQAGVPEPGSLGLFALGATGLLIYRRRRQSRKA